MRALSTIMIAAFLVSCGAVEQPQWAEPMAGYGISAATEQDREDLLIMLDAAAKSQGHHMDARPPEGLEALSSVYRQTINACVWKGDQDKESMACAQDFEARLGLIYLTFTRGSEPAVNIAFHDEVTASLSERFGPLAILPRMPNGAYPLAQELIRENGAYTVSDEVLRR